MKVWLNEEELEKIADICRPYMSGDELIIVMESLALMGREKAMAMIKQIQAERRAS